MTMKDMKEMIDFYLDKKLKVHVKLESGKFYNGEIVEWENDSVIIFNDRYLGMIHLFVTQISRIEDFTEVLD